MPYDYPGDPELAGALVEAGLAERVPTVLTAETTLPLDYGTIIPLRYLTPANHVPIVPISLCHLADLGETLRWGRAIGVAVRDGRKRVILAVTGALSHRLRARPRALAGAGVPGARRPDDGPLRGGRPGRARDIAGGPGPGGPR